MKQKEYLKNKVDFPTGARMRTHIVSELKFFEITSI